MKFQRDAAMGTTKVILDRQQRQLYLATGARGKHFSYLFAAASLTMANGSA